MAVTATIATGTRPHHMQISSNGRYLFFGVFGTNRVGVIDTGTAAYWEYATTEPSNVTARTHSVWPTSDGKYLYAANSETTNTAANGFVVKLDATDGTILWSLNVGNQPSEVTVTLRGTSSAGPVGALFTRLMTGQLERDNRRSVQRLAELAARELSPSAA